MTSEHASHWSLVPEVTFLNHGSFGACPREVLRVQQDLRDRLERQPVQFFLRDLEGLLDQARTELGRFVGAPPEDLAFVPNATHAVNTVMRSFPLESEDQILTTDHAYNACQNTMEYVASQRGAKVVVARVPFPLASASEVTDSVIGKVTRRTRIALLDHVTSPTGLIFPIQELIPALAERGVATLVDGAHAPGMIPLEVERSGAAFYTGNCHKWLCAPKGAAFLYVRKDFQSRIRPLAISHGANSPRTDRSRFRLEFDWAGTDDPTAFLSVPAAIRFMEKLLPGGWPAIMSKNHELTVSARRVLCATLNVAIPSPDEMLGSMAAIPLPKAKAVGSEKRHPLEPNPLYQALLRQFGMETMVSAWPDATGRVLRVSCQLYNSDDQYRELANAVAKLLDQGE